jgi:citronellol/citronellal dehydrogenase
MALPRPALERFTQGVAQEVAQYDGITIAALSPSLVIPTPGTIHHKLVAGIDDPKGEPPILMALGALLLASETPIKANGRVTCSQQILKEFGWIVEAKGRGVTIPGSGYSLV